MPDISARRAGLSPAQLALLRDRLRGNPAARTDDAITPRGTEAPTPLSFAQQRLWFAWKLDPQSTAYHLCGGLRFEGVLDTEALRQSFDTLVARHEALRTVFRSNDTGAPEQIVQATAAVSLEWGDAAPDGLPAAVRRLCDTPFDLARGPLLRAVLFKTGDAAHELIVVMHHIVSDAWSTQLILDELASAYRAELDGRPAQLTALAIQYADYALWQRQWLGNGEAARQLDYWRTQLGSEHTVLQLPTNAPRQALASYHAANHALTLPPEVLAQAKQRAQAAECTLFAVLLAAFQALMHRYTGQVVIRAGVPFANRNRAETAGVVGFFINTQVLQSTIDVQTTLAQLVAQVRDASAGAQAHQDLPFEQLVEALQPERSLSHHPLFQVMFNHVRRDARSLAEWPGLSVTRLDLPHQSAQFELVLESIEQEDGQLQLALRYAAELFTAGTIARMAEHYVAMVRALATQPDTPVSDVTLLGDEEQAQLHRFSVNADSHGTPEPVHHQIERQVRAHPDSVALVFGEQSL
ncbi:condensation domain-containing protein, partial [Pandoraea sp. NPDC087047]|uniref:condensation domain-containing protein n=1 Tax=Pandoraea sp. NPDC087047 TaxID=3364390 RepID=UPI0037FDB2BA